MKKQIVIGIIPKGFKILSDHKAHLAHSLVVLETTGGYENACLNFLLDKD